MPFDRKIAPEICEKLLAGVDEEIIATYHGLSLPELYNLVDGQDSQVARKCLKHFCKAYINYVCLMWPNCEEHFCDAFGYAPECPQKK